MTGNIESPQLLLKQIREALDLRRQGRLDEAMRIALSTYEVAKQSTDAIVVGECSLALGYIHHDLDDWNSAERFYSEAADAFADAGDVDHQTEARLGLGILCLDRGEMRQAEKILLGALTDVEKVGNSKLIGAACANLGLIYADIGQLEKAMQFHQRALEMFEEIDSDRGRAREHTNIGLLQELMGDIESALAHHEKALLLDQRLGDAGQLALDYGNLGDFYFNYFSDYERAQNCYCDCLKFARQSGSRRALGNALNGLGWIALHRDDLSVARENFAKSLDEYQQIELKKSEADAHVQLGQVLARCGDVGEAKSHCQIGLKIYDRLGNLEGQIYALLHLGQIALQYEDNPSQAISELNRAILLLAEFPHLDLTWRVYVELGGAHFKLADLESAHNAFVKAEEAVQRMQNSTWKEHSRIAMLGSREGLYAALVMLSLMRWTGEGSSAFIESMEFLERGRSRALLEMLGRTPLSPRHEIDPQLLQRETELQRRLQYLTDQMADDEGENGVALLRQANSIEQELSGVLDEFAEFDAEYVSLRRCHPITWSELRECLRR